MSKRICRLCLAYTSVCFSLLEQRISEMLKALTSIKVNPDDAISTTTCTKCLLNLKLAFNIQQRIVKADEKLKTAPNTEIKLENSDISTQIDVITSWKKYPKGEKHYLSACMICGLEVETGSLTKHVQAHFDDKQICDVCNKECSSIKEYKKHISDMHQQNQHANNYTCKTCGSVFHYKTLYNLHLNKAHGSSKRDKGPFICEICQKQFQYKKQLMNHTHQRKRCPICNLDITKNNYTKHVQNHSSGPQICELCGATLRSLESLRGHLAHTHSTELYTCEECGRTFKKRYPYLLHKKKHAGEKSHICEICGKAFLTLYFLNTHIKTTHLKLRPFVCQYCNKAFSSKFGMRTHIRQHTNETPYRCEICGDGFRQNVSLRAHRKSKHNITELKTCACSVCGKLFGSDHAVTSHMRLH